MSRSITVDVQIACDVCQTDGMAEAIHFGRNIKKRIQAAFRLMERKLTENGWRCDPHVAVCAACLSAPEESP